MESPRAVRVTPSVAEVLRVFLEDTDVLQYGYDLMSRTGQPSGKLYPILRRLVAAGWLERLPARPSETGGAPRVPYKMRQAAVPEAREELAKLTRRVAGVRPLGQAHPSW